MTERRKARPNRGNEEKEEEGDLFVAEGHPDCYTFLFASRELQNGLLEQLIL